MVRGYLARTASAFRFSQPPDAFSRSEPAGLVSCQIRSWGSPSRAFLLPCSRTPSPAPATLMTSSPPAKPRGWNGAPSRRSAPVPPKLPLRDPQNIPRLQGLAPHGNPLPFSGGLGRQGRVALLGLFPSRVFPLAEISAAFTAPPLMWFPRRAQAPRAVPLQGVLSSEIGLPLSRPPTLLGFLRLVAVTVVRVRRGSGVTSSGPGVRHRPLTVHL
jgi:hypothetical protein